jgi:hypothetical protein
MEQPHVIQLALDLARMPALARTSVLPPLPPNIVELMRIAAASPEACEAAVTKTGEPATVVIEAARFYLQQVLFRPEADCYRILGIEPTTSRATARSHMRWLLQWLHPDRNRNSWDAVYAERVLKAWREVSAADGPAPRPAKKNKKRDTKAWLPWIEQPITPRSPAIRNSYRVFIIWAVPVGLATIFLALALSR